MKPLLTLLIILGLSSAYSQELELDSLSSYLVDGKGVTEESFYLFLGKLEQVKGTWYCDDMSDGGQTGYDAQDKNGVVYSYYCLTHPTDSHCAIERMEE